MINTDFSKLGVDEFMGAQINHQIAPGVT